MTETTQDPKLYYCEDKQSVCITNSCPHGKDPLESFQSSRDSLEDLSYMGYGKRFIPGELITRLKFKDGSEMFIDGSIPIVHGCE